MLEQIHGISLAISAPREARPSRKSYPAPQSHKAGSLANLRPVTDSYMLWC